MALGKNWVVKGDIEKSVRNFVAGIAEHLNYKWFKAHSNQEFAQWLIKELPIQGFCPPFNRDEIPQIRKYVKEHANELYDLASELSLEAANKTIKQKG